MGATVEPIQDIAHLGRVEILTPKPDKSLWYFRDILGMEVVHLQGPSVFLRGYGDHAAATIKLTDAKLPGIGCIGWRAVSPQALERRVHAIERSGMDQSGMDQSGLGLGWHHGDFGRGPAYRFKDPDGHLMEVYYEEGKYQAPPALRSTLKNLPMKYTGRGVNVRRLDHLALLAKDVAANRTFMQTHLGLRLREQVRFQGGAVEIGSWLSSSAVHHEIAYVKDVKGAHGRLHHVSLWVDNRDDVLRAADILSENNIRIEAGPAKHNNSQGFYLYAFEPGGNRIEIYSGSYLVFAPDWEPIIWNEEERGTGVYWGGPLPETFLHYATPDVASITSEPSAIIPDFVPH